MVRKSENIEYSLVGWRLAPPLFSLTNRLTCANLKLADVARVFTHPLGDPYARYGRPSVEWRIKYGVAGIRMGNPGLL